MDDPANLDIDPAAMRALIDGVAERVVAHLKSLPQLPSFGDLDGAEALCRDLAQPPPEQGRDLEEALAPLFDDWIYRSYNSAGGGYLAYVPGGGVFPAALGGFVADALNRYTGLWNAAPALVQLEANVLDWFRQWLGMPAATRGLLTSGGSLATFGAVVTAREHLLGTELRRGVLYTSSQAHHSVAKAARLAGILADRVRIVDVDEGMRLQVEALEEAMRQDRAAGLQPFMVVSAAGTTNTGAIDPLVSVGALCRREGLWHHVDAAYGGFFRLCPELHDVLRGIEEADSVTLDPHKGLFMPYGTGALLVRDGALLRRAHEASAGYLPAQPDEPYNPCQYGPELTRPYRGLPVWLSLQTFGVARFRAALLEKHQLAVEAAAQLAELEELELLRPPELSLFAFRVGWPGAGEEQRNDATRALMERVSARRRVMVTGAQTDTRFFGRICVLCFRTRREHLAACLEDIEAEARAIVAERR